MKKRRTLERLSEQPFLELAPDKIRRAGGGFVPSCDPNRTYGTSVHGIHDVESPAYCN